MINSLKTKWQGLKYWQKGALIGIILGFIIIPISFLTIRDNFYESLGGFLIYLPFSFYSLFCSSSLCLWSALTYAIFTAPIFYAIIGALIGFIIWKVRAK